MFDLSVFVEYMRKIRSPSGTWGNVATGQVIKNTGEYTYK